MIALYAAKAGDGRSAARSLLAHALREVYGLAALPAMERSAQGKPYFPTRSDIRFNLSHSGPYALCAVGDAEVGVDLEVLRPRPQGLPRAALSPEELAWYEAQGGGWEAFYTLWTRKEAWVKYTGTGLRAYRREHPPLPGEQKHGLHLRTFTGEFWVASVCAGEAVVGDIHWAALPNS